MKATELRIGNWFIDYSGPVPQKRQATGWLIDYFSKAKEVNGSLYDVDGIPLTPEILEKCGFIDAGDGVLEKSFSVSEFSIWFNGVFLGIKQWGSVGVTPPINFLHQLQNLYFALTGEELQYQP